MATYEAVTVYRSDGGRASLRDIRGFFFFFVRGPRNYLWKCSSRCVALVAPRHDGRRVQQIPAFTLPTAISHTIAAADQRRSRHHGPLSLHSRRAFRRPTRSHRGIHGSHVRTEIKRPTDRRQWSPHSLRDGSAGNTKDAFGGDRVRGPTVLGSTKGLRAVAIPERHWRRRAGCCLSRASRPPAGIVCARRRRRSPLPPFLVRSRRRRVPGSRDAVFVCEKIFKPFPTVYVRTATSPRPGFTAVYSNTR